ncbi:MAG: aminotransferase class V-fold PLP-dependent enzyme [Spirochaetia bacterium]|nr:aminotransferase class V-fold PLP-dependent enzyme [Spirochaetia bacterium]
MNRRSVYMDNNATTQMAPEVWQAMVAAKDLYGNASSMHGFGRVAAHAVSKAREQVATLLDCAPEAIYFTSGATESNNMVFNIARTLIDEGSRRNRIVTTKIEHPATIETVKYLKGLGYKIDELSVDATGLVDLGEVKAAMGDDVLLVSVMTGNNETGTIQPVREISELAHGCGALMHTDATQAIGKIPVDFKGWHIDYLSLSAHKFYGPKGIGVLACAKGAPLFPLLHGGHQEGGYRPGTYNNQAIVGLGVAAELARRNLGDEQQRLWQMREALRKGLVAAIPDVVVNGNNEHCLPGTLNMSFPRAEGESILLYLDLEGIAVSTGSACATGSLKPSYVLLAGGLDVELAHGSIRFSLGRYNTMDDVTYVVEKLPPIIERIRMMSTRQQ